MDVLLSLFHEAPSHPSTPHFQRFLKENVLERLHSLDAAARKGGLAALDPAADPLVPLGTEIDSRGQVTKNSYGVFNLSWQAQEHTEWPAQVVAEVHEIRERIREAHHQPLR